MIEIDFGETGGGRVAFNSARALQRHLDQEISDWDASLHDYLASQGGGRSASSKTIVQLRERWAQASNIWAGGPQNIDQAQAMRQLQDHIGSIRYIAFAGREGQSIVHILREYGEHAAAGAAKWELEPVEGDGLHGYPKLWQRGVFLHWANTQGISRKSAGPIREALKLELERHRQRNSEHSSELEALAASHQHRLDRLRSLATAQIAQYRRAREWTRAEISSDREAWGGEWLALRHLFEEQLQLKAAVKQWTDRGAEHADNFRKQRRSIYWVGTIGFVLFLGFAAAMVSLAKWLFTDVLVAPNALAATAATGNGLRPTWLQELIFAASGSLLFLTLFLWTMRILVRAMMTEHHLSLDAKFRASMAHTYLALLEKNAATDADRAIVLASLFRPVSDGIVKDDALPLVSPAAIISGKLNE